MLRNGLMLLFPLLFLTACGSNAIKVETQTVKLAPPVELTAPTIVPQLIGNTNNDLLFWSLDLKSGIESCNTDKSLIREWVKGK